ncbi:ABC transporter permease [Candidatus Saccharibacteria bacterium]|nr:MAG: ABC transporter permease [Candidatus Saccharibacteria bacterium]
MQKIFKKENRAVLRELVVTDFKLRYQGSILGYAWSLLRPLFMFSITYLVFAVVFKAGKGVPHYPVYLLLGIVLWTYFGDVTTQGIGAIVARGDLIRKIRIPRWLIVLSVSIGATINLLLNLVVVLVFIIISKTPISAGVLFLPIYIAEIYLFALGISLFLSALYVRYRDISYIWDIITQAGFYLTPILYPITKNANLLASHWTALKVMYINPVAHSIQGIRNVVVTQETLTISEIWNSNYAWLLPLGVILVSLVFGVVYFKKQARTFAEDI